MQVKCFDTDHHIVKTEGVLPVRLFESSPSDDWASIGLMVAKRIRIERLDVPEHVRDFLRIGLAVVAADHGVWRSVAQDGWTRQIHLEVPVENTDVWNEQKPFLERMLKFLTGDIWNLTFKIAAFKLEHGKKKSNYLKGNTVALLSGGADSLVGALDLASTNQTWTAISQSSSDTSTQTEFAAAAQASRHLQWTHGVHIPYQDEGSQRARSIGFFVFALVAATGTEAYRDGSVVDLHASENGLISLNPALTPTRIGSASTRTTHPCFIGQLQGLLDRLSIRVKLKNDYQLLTKGEMYSACKNPKLFENLVGKSMSCGKGGRINMHCGRCVPCIIRRAAFHRSGIKDATNYRFSTHESQFRNSDDVKCAYIGSANHNDRKWVENAVLPGLFECHVENRKSLVDVAQRGLEEVHKFLIEAFK